MVSESEKKYEPEANSSRSAKYVIVFVILGVLVLSFVLAYGWLAVTRHQRFNSTGYDLAINEQIVWNTLHGRFFASSLEVGNSFADHFRPFLLVLLPFYALAPRAETLLVIQTLVLALAAIPIFLLALDKIEDAFIALILAALYLLYPAVGFISRFDFHIEVFAIPAFIAAFLAMERERWVWATLLLLVPLLVKENMGLTVAMFGLYAILMLRRLRWGAFWLILGMATFLVTTFWLLPAVRGESLDAFSRYQWLGESPQAMITNGIQNPLLIFRRLASQTTLHYLSQLFLPLAFFSLLGLPELFLAAPGLLTNILADHFCQPTIYCQYTVPIIPFIFIAVIYGFFRIKKWQGSANGLRILALVLLFFTAISFRQDNPFANSPLLPPALQTLENADVVRLALDVVPDGLSVVTSNDYAPHLAQREGLYIVGIPAQRETPLDPDLIFLNLYDQQYVTCDQIYAYLQKIDRDQYGFIFRTGGLLVLQRGAAATDQFRELINNWNNCAG